MGKLAKKILAAREFEVTVGAWTFIVRRPDAMESARWAGLDGQELAERILATCVIGWKNVLERDLIGDGGSDLPIDFDVEDFLTWSRDRPEIWGPVTQGVIDAVTRWTESIEISRKN